MGHGAMASVASTDTQLSTEDTPTEDITMESAMLRPSPTHGAMASVASTDTQLSTEDTPMEDVTMESAMLRPNPMLTLRRLRIPLWWCPHLRFPLWWIPRIRRN